MGLPRFEVVARRRPVALLGEQAEVGAVGAPYVACEADGPGAVELELASGRDRLVGRWDGRWFSLEVEVGGRRTTHRSRRDGRPDAQPDAVALTLTGRHLAVHGRHGGTWTVRGRVGLGATVRSGRPRGPQVAAHDEGWLAGLTAQAEASGAFGQVGLRDLRVVTHADGSTYDDGRGLLLSATSAGPGFFDTAHTSLWRLEPTSLALTHAADLFFRRPGCDGVFGDHATHVLRDGERWLVATSTWGDFDPRVRGAGVEAVLAETTADLTRGRHVLDTRPLALPTTGLTSVGVWDPHLVRTEDGWLVAYVSASRFFRFHPVLAEGPDLERLRLRAALTDRRATEGVTLLRLGERWVVAASDGRDNPRGLRARYPLLDLDLREVGELRAAYPGNIPWPTLTRDVEGEWLLVGFDGRGWGGRLVGYGTHGDVVIQRGRAS